MTKLTLPIEAGKQYVQRNGIVIAADPTARSSGSGQILTSPTGQAVYVATGRYWQSKIHDTDYDLVADYIEPVVTEPASVGHVHAASMLLYAQDAAETDKPWERWERRYRHTDWVENVRGPEWNLDHEYRRKPPAPKFIDINGFKVPEPMRVAPMLGTPYWVLHITSPASNSWDGFQSEMLMLDAGRCHLTREAAELNAAALLSFTKAKP